MRYLFSVAAGIFLAASAGAATLELNRFPYIKELGPAGAARGNIGSFELDDELLDATLSDCSNLRIIDAGGAETPFLVRTRTETDAVVHRRRQPALTVSLQNLPDNRIELIVDRGEPRQAPVAVVLETRQSDYEKTVSVYGSDDRDGWRMVGGPAPIFDYSRYVDLKNDRIDLSGPSYKYYRFEIDNIAESQQSPLVRFISETRAGESAAEIKHASFVRKDFRIESIVFEEETSEVVKGRTVIRQYPVRDLRVVSDAGKQTTVVTFRTVRAPIRSIILSSDTPNFSRAVTVDARDGDNEAAGWKKVAAAGISRIDLPSIRRDNLEIALGGTRRYTEYRLTIHNLDSPAINLLDVAVRGDVREILFFSKPGGDYRAVYGAKEMDPPSYDIASVVRDTVLADTDVYSPGPQTGNPTFDARVRCPRVGGRAMLVVAVLAMVAALTWLIARAVKGIGALGG